MAHRTNNMNTYWYDKLIDVLRIQTNSENEKLMVLYLDKELRKLKLPYQIDAAGNVIITKGKAKTYPCVVSHMDTVHNFVDNFGVYYDKDNKDILFAMAGKVKVGIGGDDKCGVFACLYLLKTMPQIKIVFFSREENGCKGSTDINKGFFADCRYLIQLDRRGSRDFIQTYWGNKTISHEFASEIGLVKKKYRYKNCIGTVTDVMKLWNSKVGVSCINLSCGYYNPHSNTEHISVKALWHSVKFVEEIINTMQPKRYVSLPPKPTVVKASHTIYSYNSNYDQCVKCKTWRKEAFLFDVWNKIDHITEKVCWSCKKTITKSALVPKEKEQQTKVGDKNTGGGIIYACHECGITTAQMEKGDSLKYRGDDSQLYCNKCASIFFAPIEKPVNCEVCEGIIPKDHYRTTIQGMLVCGVCACVLHEGDNSPKECFVCNKVIPKDHKIIERFGVRVCEDCACPSDIIIVEN